VLEVLRRRLNVGSVVILVEFDIVEARLKLVGRYLASLFVDGLSRRAMASPPAEALRLP
jgi:hypothetical protein